MKRESKSYRTLDTEHLYEALAKSKSFLDCYMLIFIINLGLELLKVNIHRGQREKPRLKDHFGLAPVLKK